MKQQLITYQEQADMYFKTHWYSTGAYLFVPYPIFKQCALKYGKGYISAPYCFII